MTTTWGERRIVKKIHIVGHLQPGTRAKSNATWTKETSLDPSRLSQKIMSKNHTETRIALTKLFKIKNHRSSIDATSGFQLLWIFVLGC